MKMCSEGCVDACDFCVHYEFNGDKSGAYTGDGFCQLHHVNADPHETCDDFHCFNVKNEKNNGI